MYNMPNFFKLFIIPFIKRFIEFQMHKNKSDIENSANITFIDTLGNINTATKFTFFGITQV